MFVQSWAVGATTSTDLPMTAGDISGHLLADWIPSFPLALSSSFIGWPSFLIETVNLQAQQFLTLASVARTSERQWKGVLSWMLGVAGARHVLASEGYRWIAPMSAFYPNNTQQVAIPADFPFPPSSMSVSRDPSSASVLRPDYLALRPVTGGQIASGYEWAVAEAKGTASALTNMHTAPQAWSDQVRNAVVTVDGVVVKIPRNVVICTRVNPNAARPQTRRLQLRAWNRKDGKAEHLSSTAAADVAAAHLFGLFRGLHLPIAAAAVAHSVELRVRSRDKKATTVESNEVRRTFEIAQQELKRRTRASPSGGTAEDTWLDLTTPLGEIDIALAAPLLDFARELSDAQTDDEAAAALRKADSSLNGWELSRRSAMEKADFAILNTGIAVSSHTRQI
jgi:hypothetical protein